MAPSGRPYDEDLVLDREDFVNRQTGTRPCVLHTPGKYVGVLEYYSRRLLFYREVRWSYMSPRIVRRIAKGYFTSRPTAS